MHGRSTKQRRAAMRRNHSYKVKATDPRAVWVRSTPGYYFAAPLIIRAPSWSARIVLVDAAPPKETK